MLSVESIQRSTRPPSQLLNQVKPSSSNRIAHNLPETVPTARQNSLFLVCFFRWCNPFVFIYELAFLIHPTRGSWKVSGPFCGVFNKRLIVTSPGIVPGAWGGIMRTITRLNWIYIADDCRLYSIFIFVIREIYKTSLAICCDYNP